MARENCTLYRDKFITDCNENCYGCCNRLYDKYVKPNASAAAIENNISIYHIPNAANANKGFYNIESKGSKYPRYIEIDGECWRTPERDICYCKGDKCQCVYLYVKQKALKEKQSKRGKVDIVRTLQHYLDFNEENGVVYIPKVTIEKMIEDLKDNER